MRQPRKPPTLTPSDLRKFKEALLPITAELRAIRKQLAKIERKEDFIIEMELNRRSSSGKEVPQIDVERTPLI